MACLNVLTALYQTYLNCEENQLVDITSDLNVKAVLLPIFHTNKKSDGKNIIEIVLDEDGNYVRATYLNNKEIIIFPVTEDSISRANGSAPHSISDELSYLTSAFSEEKHQDYMAGLEKWVAFNEDRQDFPQLKKIYDYLKKKTIIADLIASLYPKATYSVGKEGIQLSGLEKPLNLSPKIFISFKIETLRGKDLNISTTVTIHQNYIAYAMAELENKEKGYCNISGEVTYCSRKHRGLFGNAKLVSVSNKKETYYGRFKDGDEITKIGYITSQKIHNMLKYLLENKNTSQYLDQSASIVTWPSVGIEQFEWSITDEASFDWSGEEESLENDFTINSKETQVINDYIKGRIDSQESTIIAGIETVQFYTLVVDKVSNGRVSIKYFRSIAISDLIQRVNNWYATTNWEYGYGEYKKIKTPSLKNISEAVYGQYDRSTNRLFLRNEKLQKKTMERLLPCIVDQKKIPIDMIQKIMVNASNRIGYREGWNQFMSRACSLIKKYKWDYYSEEVTSVMDENSKSKDYLYGGILAILEAIEIAATDTNKITNAEKYWSIYMQAPASTHLKLQEKIRPYLDRLKRNKENNWKYQRYTKALENLSNKITSLELSESQRNKKLNEDFLLGYYAQRKALYTKTVKPEEE